MSKQSVSAQAPIAARRATTRSFHGDDFIDHYEWLRDKESQEVVDYMNAENDYTRAQTQHFDALTDELAAEFEARTQLTDQSVATYRQHSDGAAYWYYSRTLEGSDYPILCRVPAADRSMRPDLSHDVAGEQVLLDCNEAAAGHDFFSIGGFEVSPNGQLVAYLTDTEGAEHFQLTVKDLRSGDVVDSQLTDVHYGVCWAGNDWLFYTLVDEAWRPYQLWRHRLGADKAEDTLVMQEDDPEYMLAAESGADHNYIVVYIVSTTTTECHLISTSEPEAAPRCVARRESGIHYTPTTAGDRLLIVHNKNCIDFELAEAPLDATSSDQWRTVIGGEIGVRIESVEAYQDWAVVTLRRAALTTLHVMRRVDGELQPGADLSFDEPIYEVFGHSAANYADDRLTYTYTSMVTPSSVFELNMATGERVLLKETPILDDPKFGPYIRENFVQKREWAAAQDGTQIPISVLHHKDLVLDGSNPCLITGYGSYEMSNTANFRMTALMLAERGAVFAVAHIRGGGDMGRSWYLEGKELKKKNSFTDFVDCAQHMIKTGYTNPQKLAAQGRSAGGLLMGAVINLAPETFRAVHAGVPFVDALTTITKPELPLTAGEWQEWGNPITDPEVYAYMKSYSPYENIRPVSYPAILATTGFNDTRVFYVEPAKWVAEMRHTLPDSSEVLLRTEMAAGHGGVSGRSAAWKQVAFEYAWILDKLGVSAK